jgi:DNA-binding NarL/FixJ family response regulator
MMLARDVPGAIRVGERAVELATESGLPGLAARALNAVGTARWFTDPDLGVRTPRRTTLSHPDGLTERQADVLALLREGLGNAAIAARLSISPKAVDHHVSAIIARLGVRSRHEAARRVPGGGGQ